MTNTTRTQPQTPAQATTTTGPARRPNPGVLHYAAFTTTPTGGNGAGVVLDASSLSDTEMVTIAAELGYSESAFVTPGPRPLVHAAVLQPQGGGGLLRPRHRGDGGRAR